MLEGTKLKSIILGSCPKCQRESMYLHSNPYNLLNLYKMHEKCSHCHTVYQVEPAFFYGAMYVSYALGVALGIAIFLITYVFMDWTLKLSFIAIIISLIVLMPLLIRLSRNIWINFFIHFDKNFKKD